MVYDRVILVAFKHIDGISARLATKTLLHATQCIDNPNYIVVPVILTTTRGHYYTKRHTTCIYDGMVYAMHRDKLDHARFDLSLCKNTAFC